MSYLVLARKWRPKNFHEVVGQAHVITALTNALTQGRLHHAYLLTGTRGVGKTTLARILAKSLNCETGVTATPCGQCTACREIDSGRFVDLLEMDAASNTGIDNMREVLDNAQYMPTAGRYKIYLIDEVHMLSKPAFNSMLKTLEEPPEHVKFILATTDPQKIPVTILSRCLQFSLKQMTANEVAGHLQHVLDQEAIAHDEGALRLLGRAAHGSMRDALSLLDQAIAYSGGQVSETQVRQMLGSIDQSYLHDLLDALARKDGEALLEQVRQLAGRGVSFDNALQELAIILHQVALAQTLPQAISEDLPEASRIRQLAAALSAEDIQLYYQIALNGRKDLPLAPDEEIGFSMALLRMLAFAVENGTDARPAAAPARPASTVARLEPRAPRQAEPFNAGQPAPEVVKATPAPAVRPPVRAVETGPAAEPVNGFDGDWVGLVPKLKLSGMGRMLAQHCALEHYDGQQMQLAVASEFKHLLDKNYQDRVKAALRAALGSHLEISISTGQAVAVTPARREQQIRQEKLEQATSAIQQDEFVQELMTKCDAQIIENSIKPKD
jgi:DNA polymerase III subunit gamma/tau